MSSSTPDTTAPAAVAIPTADWQRIGRQIWGILRNELGRLLLTRRAFQLYLLAFVPVAILVLWALTEATRHHNAPIEVSPIYAFIFTAYQRIPIFFGCLVLFMNLFRSEVLERSLHYYFLTPLRREVLVAGKYVSALLATVVVFGLGTTLLYLAAFGAWGPGPLMRHLFDGPGLSHLIAYVGISTMACLGYGAVFLLAGIFFKNPIVIGVLLWGWELINPFLPALLKKFSVVFYLSSLTPVPVPSGPFAVLADPISPWVSVPGLMLFTAAVLAVAGWTARRMEIHYGDAD